MILLTVIMRETSFLTLSFIFPTQTQTPPHSSILTSISLKKILHCSDSLFQNFKTFGISFCICPHSPSRLLQPFRYTPYHPTFCFSSSSMDSTCPSENIPSPTPPHAPEILIIDNDSTTSSFSSKSSEDNITVARFKSVFIWYHKPPRKAGCHSSSPTGSTCSWLWVGGS